MKRNAATFFVILLCIANSSAQSQTKRPSPKIRTRGITDIRQANLGKVGKTINSPSGGFSRVEKIVYGDLTGDGAEEAVVVVTENGGGSGVDTSAMVYTLRNGRLEKLKSKDREGYGPYEGIVGGDRGRGGIRDVRIERGMLLVEQYAPDDGNSSKGPYEPAFIDTVTYRWNGSIFLPDKNIQRRRIQ